MVDGLANDGLLRVAFSEESTEADVICDGDGWIGDEADVHSQV